MWPGRHVLGKGQIGVTVTPQLTVVHKDVVGGDLVHFNPGFHQLVESRHLNVFGRRSAESPHKCDPQRARVVAFGVVSCRVPSSSRVHVTVPADQEVETDIVVFHEVNVEGLLRSQLEYTVGGFKALFCSSVGDHHHVDGQRVVLQRSSRRLCQPIRPWQGSRSVFSAG